MLVLGFNYKAAIGEPLTQLCADAILSKVRNNGNVSDEVMNMAKEMIRKLNWNQDI